MSNLDLGICTDILVPATAILHYVLDSLVGSIHLVFWSAGGEVLGSVDLRLGVVFVPPVKLSIQLTINDSIAGQCPVFTNYKTKKNKLA